MKTLLYILALVLLTFGCNNKNPNEKPHIALKDTTYLKLQVKDSTNDKLYEISGTILYKKTWCGGVQINPHDNTYKLNPYNNKKILLIKGTLNSDTCTIVEELITNAKAEFKFDVKSGDYGIIIEEGKQVKFKLPAYNFENIGMIKCLKKEYKKPDLIVKVTDKSIEKLKYTVIGYCSGGNICNPCGGTGRP